ncbi:MAG: hypothetical protein FWD61_20350 [Phycisphaerales bacterium]|nr:hypothetical protein [Phycisphaerales bacterium]
MQSHCTFTSSVGGDCAGFELLQGWFSRRLPVVMLEQATQPLYLYQATSKQLFQQQFS